MIAFLAFCSATSLSRLASANASSSNEDVIAALPHFQILNIDSRKKYYKIKYSSQTKVSLDFSGIALRPSSVFLFSFLILT
jgi:hypothetical protein